MLQPSTAVRLPARDPRTRPTRWDLLNGLFFYWRSALVVFGAVMALGCLAALLLPPKYGAEARLLALNAGYYDIRPERAGAAPAQVFRPEEVLSIEMQLLASAEVHRRVVEQELGATASREQVDAALRAFKRQLHIGQVEMANVLEISFTDDDPTRAAAMLKRLLLAYFDQRARVLTSGRVALLTHQREGVKAQLDRLSAEISAFQARHNVVDVAAQIHGAVTLDDQLRQQRLNAETELARQVSSLGRLRGDARGVGPTVELFRDDTEVARALGNMQGQLLALEARRADFASRYMADSPQVIQLDKQIAGLRTAIAGSKLDLAVARRVGHNDYYDVVRDRLIQSDAALAGERARRAALNQQIAQSSTRLQSLITVADSLARMQVQRDLLLTNYRDLANQLQGARAQEAEAATGSTNVRVIQSPVVPDERSNSPAMLVAGSMIAGLTLAGASLFLCASLRETFLTPQEMERVMGLPVLSPPLRIWTHEEHRNDCETVVAGIDSRLPAGSKVILLAAPSVGSSLQLVAAQLAKALEHRAPGRVISVRFEERLYRIAHRTGSKSSDEPDVRPLVRIGSPAWTIEDTGNRLLAELRGRYDYVLVTAPPVSISSAFIDAAPQADAVLIVAQAEQTRKPAIDALLDQLAKLNVNILGLILTGSRSHIPAPVARLAGG